MYGSIDLLRLSFVAEGTDATCNRSSVTAREMGSVNLNEKRQVASVVYQFIVRISGAVEEELVCNVGHVLGG